MSDSEHTDKPKAVYEPGTLDHVRKNIGELDPQEAKHMAKVLGGEIFTEKSAPVCGLGFRMGNFAFTEKKQERRHQIFRRPLKM